MIIHSIGLIDIEEASEVHELIFIIFNLFLFCFLQNIYSDDSIHLKGVTKADNMSISGVFDVTNTTFYFDKEHHSALHKNGVIANMTVSNLVVKVLQFDAYKLTQVTDADIAGFHAYSDSTVALDSTVCVRSGGLRVTGGMTIYAGGARLTGGLTVQSGGIAIRLDNYI